LHYDPVKYRLARLLKIPFLRFLFHKTLDTLFLRAWYVHRELVRICNLSIDNYDISISSPNYVNSKSRIQNPKFLDAGMGFGQFSDWLLRRFPASQVVGLEIDRAHLYGCEDYFRQRHNAFRFALGDVQNLPFRGASFDLIWAVDVIEHIADDDAAFQEFNRILKPGGRFLMHTPRIPEALHSQPQRVGCSATFSETNSAFWSVDEHKREGYSDREAVEKLTAAGLKVDKIIRSYGAAGRLAWNLLQRVPLGMMAKNRFLAPAIGLYLILVFLPAIMMMWLDWSRRDHPNGGGLLIVAKK